MNEIFLYILYFIFCLTHLAASHKFGCLSASQKTPDILNFYLILFYLMYRSSLTKHTLVKICPKECFWKLANITADLLKVNFTCKMFSELSKILRRYVDQLLLLLVHVCYCVVVIM